MAHLNPGPSNNQLLWLQAKHRSASLFENIIDHATELDIRRGDQAFWSAIKNRPLNPNVESIVRMAGFGGVIDCEYRKLDRGLITALVERWRPETHTFHLPFGETTVTLEDVNVLMGLRVNGPAIAGLEEKMTHEQRLEKVQSLLGIDPEECTFRGNGIPTTLLVKKIKKQLLEGADINQITQQARCVVLLILGNTLFCDSNNGVTSLSFLNHVESLDTCGEYSWGSAVLTCLYRNLCKAAVSTNKTCAGPMYLLQLWAWTRIRVIAPQCLHQLDLGKPYGAIWRGKHKLTEVASHSLRQLRSQLQNLQEESFIWRPYEEYLASLPEICKDGSDCWRCECFIVWFQVVEYHSPSRVLRQFGLCQGIPDRPPLTPEVHNELHNKKQTGKPYASWFEEHAKYVDSWYNRLSHRVDGEETPVSSVYPGYMQWYSQITVGYITNPAAIPTPQTGFRDDGGIARFLMEGYTKINQQASQFMSAAPAPFSENFGVIQNTARSVMSSIRVGDLLNYPSRLQNHLVGLVADGNQPQRERGPRQNQRHVGVQQPPPCGTEGRYCNQPGCNRCNCNNTIL